MLPVVSVLLLGAVLSSVYLFLIKGRREKNLPPGTASSAFGQYVRTTDRDPRSADSANPGEPSPDPNEGILLEVCRRLALLFTLLITS